MLKTVQRFFQRAFRLFRNKGIMGFIQVGSKPIRYFLAGVRVTLTGNMVRLDDCQFDLNHPAIVTSLKGSLYLGEYEQDERKAIARFLDPALSVIELGAGIGVVSCITNKKLAHPDQHIVVEANPQLLPVLERNRALNQAQFSIHHAAFGYDNREIPFYVHSNLIFSSAQYRSQQSIIVSTVDLQTLLSRFELDKKCTLICDIEGAEKDLINRELNLLIARVATFIVEVHPLILGEEAVQKLLQQLSEQDFELVFTSYWTHVFRNKRF